MIRKTIARLNYERHTEGSPIQNLGHGLTPKDDLCSRFFRNGTVRTAVCFEVLFFCLLEGVNFLVCGQRQLRKERLAPKHLPKRCGINRVCGTE